MNYMKSFFLGSTVGLVFLSTGLLVAIPSNPAQAQSQAARQAQGRQDYAPLAPSWANAYAQDWSEAQVQALTWPYFKAITPKPAFSL